MTLLDKFVAAGFDVKFAQQQPEPDVAEDTHWMYFPRFHFTGRFDYDTVTNIWEDHLAGFGVWWDKPLSVPVTLYDGTVIEASVNSGLRVHRVSPDKVIVIVLPEFQDYDLV